MTPLSFRICLTTVTLLHADFAVSSDLKDFVKTIKAKGEYSNKTKMKSLVIFIPDLPSELAGQNYQETSKRLLRSQDLSDEVLKVDNDELLPAAPIIKKNNSSNALHGHEWAALSHKLKSTSKEMGNIRQQQAMEKREREHERRVKEIVDHVSVHYQSCIYLAYEAKRIQTGRIVIDDFRKLAEDVDMQKYQGLKAKVLKCGKPIREPAPFVWNKPNKVVINVDKDYLNDGV